MADSSTENLTTRSLLKQIIATEPTRSAVRDGLRKRESLPERRKSFRISQKLSGNDSVASPLKTVRSKMKERVRRSLSRMSSVNQRRESVSQAEPQMMQEAAKGFYTNVEDLDMITPRTLLRKIMQNEPDASLIVSQKSLPAGSQSTEQETSFANVHTTIGNLEMSLDELQEDDRVAAFGNKKKKRISITQFEQGVEQRLTQTEERSLSQLTHQEGAPSGSLQRGDQINTFEKPRKKKRISVTQFEQGVEQRLTQMEESTIRHFTQQSNINSSPANQSGITKFLQSSMDTSDRPELIQKRRLVRRPKKFNFVSLEDFEQAVHENYHHLKGSQECFVESATEDVASNFQNETANMNTELYAQQGVGERSLSRLDASQKMEQEQLPLNRQVTKFANDQTIDTNMEELNNKSLTENQNLHKSDAQLKHVSKSCVPNIVVRVDKRNECTEAGNKVSDISIHSNKSQKYDSNISRRQREEENKNEYVRHENLKKVNIVDFSNEIFYSNEGEQERPEISNKINQYEHYNAGRDVSLLSKDKCLDSGFQKSVNLTRRSVSEATSSIAPKAFHQHEEGSPTQDSSKHMVNNSDRTQEEEFVSDEESRTEDVSILGNQEIPSIQHLHYQPTDTPACFKNTNVKTSKKQTGKLIPTKKNKGTKTKQNEFPSRLVKQMVNHYAKMRVSRDTYKEVETCLAVYFKQLSDDLTAYATHAKRKTITRADMELLMRRQGHVTESVPLNVLIERHLPMEYRECLIPCATSGNKIYPKVKNL